MQTISFLGRPSPAIGQGTWNIGDSRVRRDQEIATLRRGVDLGLTVIDTAEMYGDGASEALVGEAIRGRRDAVTLVTKVYPHNAGRRSMTASCEASLKRLGVEQIDLYLLHWPGQVPLNESIEAFERLKGDGKIAFWGVSNFDVCGMESLFEAGGEACATNQILYNITRRGPEFDLLPWMRARGMPFMAYSPIEQGRLPEHPALAAIASRHGVDVAAVALAFAIRSGQAMAIPKASSLVHVEANRRGADLLLDASDLAQIDAAFPPPVRKQPLAML